MPFSLLCCNRQSCLCPATFPLPPGAVVWLLQRGADLTRLKQDDWRDTALHYAAGSGSMECVQALLAWGADPTLTNALGEEKMGCLVGKALCTAVEECWRAAARAFASLCPQCTQACSEPAVVASPRSIHLPPAPARL